MDRMDTLQPMLIAHLAFKRNMETTLKKYGLHPGNPKFMLYIADHEGCSQKNLAKTFYIESCTLSSVLANMEERGFIERKKSEKDKRSYCIYTTPKGRQLLEPVRNQFKKTIETALSGFSSKETEMLYDLLDRVANNLKEANSQLI